jgi:hypothetical protein
MEELNHKVVSAFHHVLVKGQDLTEKANSVMADLKVLVSYIAYLRALEEGKSQEEAKEVGHAARSALYPSMRAIQESPAAEGILHPTLQSTVDECTAAMEYYATTQDTIATEVQELVVEVHELLLLHLEAQKNMCTVTKEMYEIVHEYKYLLPELLVLSSKTLEDSKATFDSFYTEVERRMSLAEPIYAAVCEDVQRWKDENPL